MKQYRRLFILFTLLICGVISVQAKIKVVDRSSRSVPSWVNTTEREYIITTVVAPNIQRAQDMCMENISREIILSVAQNVESHSTETIEQNIINSEIESFLNSYSTTSNIESAKVPFLTGVSISKVNDYYWEERLDKDTRQVSYLYSIKYPFTTLELKKLVYAFNERDKKMSATLERLKQGFSSVNSLTQTKNAISELEVLIEYFFDRVRKSEALDLYRRYSSIYGLISVKEIENKLGEYRFVYQYDGRDFIVTSSPTITSETLSRITTVCDDDGVWSVKYSYDTCDADEPNFADITSRFPNNKKLITRFYADIASDKLSIVPVNNIYLTGIKDDSDSIKSVEIRFVLDCNLKESVTLYQITLEVPGVSPPLFIDDLRLSIDGIGEQSVVIKYNGDIEVFKSQNNRLNMLKGSLSFYDSNNKMHKIKLSRPFICNW